MELLPWLLPIATLYLFWEAVWSAVSHWLENVQEMEEVFGW